MNKSKRLLKELRKRFVIKKDSVQFIGDGNNILKWVQDVDKLLEKPNKQYKAAPTTQKILR